MPSTFNRMSFDRYIRWEFDTRWLTGFFFFWFSFVRCKFPLISSLEFMWFLHIIRVDSFRIKDLHDARASQWISMYQFRCWVSWLVTLPLNIYRHVCLTVYFTQINSPNVKSEHGKWMTWQYSATVSCMLNGICDPLLWYTATWKVKRRIKQHRKQR